MSSEHQIGYKALPRGVPVVTTPDGRRFVDAPEVARIAERRVTLTITADEARELPEHGGTRAAMGTRAKRAGRRWKRRLSR